VLRISLERVNSHVKAVVADTGHGIPKEDLPKIFHPFFTTKEAGKGTGLGLTVVHNIVHEHGGSITVDSEPGTGTTFTLMLPASKS
jgi:signal transduction histidine kinase